MREITTQETGYVSGGSFVSNINLAGLSFAAGLFTAGFIILGGIVLLNGIHQGNNTPPFASPGPTPYPSPAPTPFPEPDVT
ncbi:hypothetical protein [Kalamiella sp. sgz302252]|uniref:hypothetical protein n=1 Tax=Pantoea sp. sgz302252 TaxID=3341827 RepID=UPI0036D33186